MRTCRIVHWGTGLNIRYDGIIIGGLAVIEESLEQRRQYAKDCLIYPMVKEMYDKALIVYGGKRYLPAHYFGLLENECDNNLVQLEVDGKWGFANSLSGEIAITPQWDWCGPFWGNYAMVVANSPLEPGMPVHNRDHSFRLPESARCGFINTKNEIVVPAIYADANCAAQDGYFIVCDIDGRWGAIDRQSTVCIPFEWGCIEKSYKDSKDGYNVYICWEKNREDRTKKYKVKAED